MSEPLFRSLYGELMTETPFCYWLDQGGCSGRLQLCHWIGKSNAQNYLRFNLGLESDYWELARWDARNLVVGCETHHHLFDYGSWALPRRDVPASVEEYAEDWGLTTLLDRRHGEKEAAS